MKGQTRKSQYLKWRVLVAVLAFAGPLGYLIGYQYYMGYLSAFGISDDLFPLTAQQSSWYAFAGIGLLLVRMFAGLAGLVSPWIFQFNLTLVVLLMLLLAIGFSVQKIKRTRTHEFIRIKHRIRRIAIKVSLAKKAFLRLLPEADIFVVSYAVFVVIFFITAIWFSLPRLSFEQGEKNGDRIRALFDRQGCFMAEDQVWSNCHELRGADGNLLYEGVLIAQTKTHVAMLTREGTVILESPRGLAVVARRNPVQAIDKPE